MLLRWRTECTQTLEKPEVTQVEAACERWKLRFLNVELDLDPGQWERVFLLYSFQYKINGDLRP